MKMDQRQKFKKHQRIVKNLENRLKKSGKYAYVISNLLINPDKQYTYGEVDLYALREVNSRDYLLFFEIKGEQFGRRKAISQLIKDENYFKNTADRVYKFFVYGVGKKDYKIERIK